jgi:hypothetical protein
MRKHNSQTDTGNPQTDTGNSQTDTGSSQTGTEMYGQTPGSSPRIRP